MPVSRITLADSVFADLLERILSGELPPQSSLPAEAEIARVADVSRLTVREALKTLQARNIVTVRRGLGTFVNHPEEWTGLEAILRAAARGTGIDEAALKLLEVRRIMETGAAELAARHATAEHFAAMEKAIADLETAHEAADLDAVTLADLAFHNVVFKASANPFLPALLGQLGHLLYTTRRETSAFPEVQRHALEHHRLVLAAIATGEPETARKAMDEHINQTYDDYARFIKAQESNTGAEPE
ncbi:FadR/GntR family transcriptional regulator [Pseudarthrobacter sp. WHRI 8279]|uniref:FadR/GntR family transcriptional regulator n=1 Tax=Pseudarthrobacter sp. WHRI 8279 TaxID=3162566 RepID=UPI0032F061BA